MSEYNEKDVAGRDSSGNPGQEEQIHQSKNTYTGVSSQPKQPSETYWSSQDARKYQWSQSQYRQEQGKNSYSPYYNTQQPGQQQGAYQYNTNSGWQQSNRNNDKYEWNFAEYERYAAPSKRKNRGLVVFTVSLICVLALSLVGLSGVALYNALMGEPDDANQVQITSSTEDVDSGEAAIAPGASGLEIAARPQVGETAPIGGRLTIPQVAETVSPSVVGIVTYQSAKFFEPTGTGSGTIMSQDGYIITNAHVIAGADAIKVTLHNGEVYEAKLAGADARTDLAVIKIEETGLSVATFGDSDSLRVGEAVVAIGNPGGLLAGSVTQGIVSAVNRQVRSTNRAMNYIQTDAAINPGNSGGALVNDFGQVVGINTAKVVAEGYEGIGFAIPISEAKPIVDDLLKHGRVTGRVLLGITPEVVDEVLAKTYNVPMGIQIVDMVPQADISTKGVQVGDIITHLDGERVYTMQDLWDAMDGHKVGDSVELTIYRQSRLTQGNTYTVKVVLFEDKG